MKTKTKNMKTRSSQMKQVKSTQDSSGKAQVQTINKIKPPKPQCDYSICKKGPELQLMTEYQLPIDIFDSPPTFTKFGDFQYIMTYTLNTNDSFDISGPFSPSSISDINNYELRQPIDKLCKCNTNSFLLRNKNLSEDSGFMLSNTTALNNSSGALINTRSQINLPTSFIIYNQEGLYIYLNVDQNSNITFSSTIY